ncbi:MAG: hypothetical protein Q9208_004004 [Pyrenodesmia sp. 3 TL-2023]
MDIAVSVSSTDHAASSYNSLRPVTRSASPPPQAQRSLQNSMSDLASTHSPRRFHTPSSRTSPTPATTTVGGTDMDLPPATIATAQPESHDIWRDVDSGTHFPPHDGQDHDRMETEDDNQESASEDEIDNPQDIEQPELDSTTQAPFHYDEIMDTTLDEPHVEEHSHGNSLGKLSRHVFEFKPADDLTISTVSGSTHSSSPSPHPAASADNREPAEPNPPEMSQSTAILPNPPALSEGETIQPPQARSPTIPSSHELATTDINPPQNIAQGADADETSLFFPPIAETLPPPPLPPPPAAEDNQNSAEQQPGREDDHDQEDSSDEEERPYWAEFVEDTSGPDEQELENIGRDRNEVNAVNHDHWESKTYEALTDPEHVPSDSGRIVWTVTPVNGTPGNPNREKIMRSPQVLIGGLYWNIKYYPRGNEGTHNMSVYIECSSSSHESDSDEDSDTDAASEPDNGAQPSAAAPSDNAVTEVQPVPPPPSETAEAPQPAEDTLVTEKEGEEDSERTRWEAAAQIGCVVYNPNEPRVNVFRKSSHHFNPQNADWGWTRFHGPWESIHLRQRNERQALLRNDTLVFSAYIRIVKDDTNSLWYHTPKEGPSWESFRRIGVKSLATGSSNDNHIIAAISCWANLRPFVDLVRSMKIPDPLKEPQERPRPLFRALQQLLEYMFDKPEDIDRNAMTNVVAWIDWYIAETSPPRLNMPEVVAVWETLRCILSYEASGMGDMRAAPDCFPNVLLLRQPDPWAAESPISSVSYGHDGEAATAAAFPQLREPGSVQETIDIATSSTQPYKPWQSFTGSSLESDELPAVLQVELHRQRYDKIGRRWDKLTHRVKLDEKITYTSAKTRAQCDYTLYGLVVHSGALESHDFYSIVRPRGPGTRWIRYSGGGHHREAACLTTKQAIAAHEGKDDQLTGNAKVAYVVLYIRTDAISDILLPSSPTQKPPTPNSTTTTPQEEMNADTKIPARVYNSTLFDSHEGRGLPDLWAVDSKRCPGLVREVTLPKSSTPEDVFGHLDDEFMQSGLPDDAGNAVSRTLHYIETGGLNTVRGLPCLKSLSPEHSLEQAIVPDNGCRLWLHTSVSVQPSTNDIVSTSTSIEPSFGTGPTETQNENSMEGPVDTFMTQNEFPEASPQVGSLHTQEEVHHVSPSPSPNAQVSSDEGALAADSTEQEREHHRAEDTVMEGTQELADEVTPGSPHVGAPVSNTIYFFLKIFDNHAQSLRAVCSHKASAHRNIHTEVASLLGTNDTLDLYIERSRALSERDRVRSSNTFDDLDLGDGCILIAHRRPSPDETAALIAQGKHADPISYFYYLFHNDNPGYLACHSANNYFGTAYHSIDLSYALLHGHGTFIDTNGDAYVGNWVSDERSGHGTMAYASGDTYTGNFAENERDGHGKMVYGKTNNVYEGGWKKGRRHGKGIMTYEVADEEMAMCKICYENEMDALLYDCGHVVACEECARQVEICPVCRKSVRGVCRIWKA